MGIERNLGLAAVLKNRMQEVHDTIGENARILDESERLNEAAVYSIYHGKMEPLSLLAEASHLIFKGRGRANGAREAIQMTRATGKRR